MSPKIIDKREKQLNVIQYAIPIFAKKGFHETKMSDIAIDADIGKGSLYEYFDSKEDLFYQAFELWSDLFYEQIEDVKKTQLEPHEKVVKVFSMYFDNAEQFQNSYYIYFDFWAEFLRHKDYANKLDQVYVRLRQSIGEILDGSITKQGLTSEQVAVMCIAVAEGLMIQWMIDHNVFHLADIGTCAIRAILASI